MRILALALFAGCHPPEPAPVDTDGSFSVLTYNVHGLPDPITGETRPLPDRMAAIAALIDADLVGLQEDWTPEGHAALVDPAWPVSYWFDSPLDATRAYGAGLDALTTLDATDYFEQHYTTCNGTLDGASDCLASKGFQVLRVRLGDADLDVYVTHHEAGGGPDDDAARATQVDEVIASMDGRSAGRAVLFMGDTNLRPSDPADAPLLQTYADAGLRDACDEVDCPEPDHIDRFLLRDGPDLALTATRWARRTEFVDDDGADLSDHPALAITVSWQAR